MPDVTGQRTTLNVNQTSRKIDMVERIKLLESHETPLFVLTGELPSAATYNPKFQWQEDELAPRFTAVNNGAGYSSSATSIVVDDGDYLDEGWLFKVTRTGELIRVQSAAGDTLTVVRGVGAVAGVAIVDNDEIVVIGPVFAEGTLSPSARSTNQTDVYNFTEITKTAIEETGTQHHTDSINSPNDWEHQAVKAGVEHKKTLEFKRWHSTRSESTVSGKPLRTSNGVLNSITTNVFDAGGAYTEDEFYTHMVPVFRHGSNVKWGFPSPEVINVLNSFPRTKQQVCQSAITDKYGIKVFEYLTPHGTLRLVNNRNFEGDELSEYLPILDLAAIRRRYLANKNGSRDTHVQKGIQANDLDGRKDQWLTEDGLEFSEEVKHALVTAVASAA